MDKRLRIAGIIAALMASALILSSPSDIPIPAPTISENGSESVEILATDLKKPRAIAFGDDRIFVTEKNGKIRVIVNNTLLQDAFATFRVASVFDGGLLGIATHPNFEENHILYAYYTYEKNSTLWNKVVKITGYDNKLKDAVTILDDIPGSPFSNGGVLKFGPDQKLYISTGAGPDSQHLSQLPDSLAGKILRINDDGTIPLDNPYPNSPVYSIGHRNPQGIAWHDNIMYISELGPEKNDEINVILPGQNYGWPHEQCSNAQSYINAKACYDPAIEPGGIVIYSGDALPLNGKMIMASLRSTNLYQMDLDNLSSPQSILGGVGRIRDVVQGPDEYLYILTSNTDGKGFPDDRDDKLVRIVK